MNVEIDFTNIDEEEALKFCEWLIPKIQEYLYASIDDRILARFDAYLNSSDIIQWQFQPQIIRTKNILIGASYNLIVKKYPTYYDIVINPNINIPNSYAKFIDIVSLIDKGNLMLQPYPIFSDTMEYFAENIDMYFKDFIEETNGN